MHTTLLGDDGARRLNMPLADLVYLQRAPVLLVPRRLRRRAAALRGADRAAAPSEREKRGALAPVTSAD